MNLENIQKEAREKFDEEFVEKKVGRIYSWNARSLSNCTGIRKFILKEIAIAYQKGVESKDKELKRLNKEIEYYKEDEWKYYELNK